LSVDIERVVQLLRALATAAGDGDDGLVLQQVCDQAVDALGVTGAGVMVMLQGEHHEVLCASDARIAVIEELQDTSGTGPCLDAYRSGGGVPCTRYGRSFREGQVTRSVNPCQRGRQ
jgi:hypothetical protein